MPGRGEGFQASAEVVQPSVRVILDSLALARYSTPLEGGLEKVLGQHTSLLSDLLAVQ